MSERYDLEDNEKWGYYAGAAGTTYSSEEYLQTVDTLPTPLPTLYNGLSHVVTLLVLTPLIKFGYEHKPVFGLAYHLVTTLFYGILVTAGYVITEFVVQPTAPNVYLWITDTYTTIITVATAYSALSVATVAVLIYSSSVYLTQPYDWYRSLGQASRRFGDASKSGGYTGPLLYSAITYVFLTLFYLTVNATGVTSFFFTALGIVFFLVFLLGIVVVSGHLFLIPVEIVVVTGAVYALPITFAETGFLGLAVAGTHYLSTDTIHGQLKSDELDSSISFYPHTRWYVLTTGMYLAGAIHLLITPAPLALVFFAIGTATTLLVYPFYRKRLPRSGDSGYKTKNDYYTESAEHRDDPPTPDKKATRESSDETATDVPETESKLEKAIRTGVVDEGFEDRLDKAELLMREQRGMTRVHEAVSEELQFQLEWAVEEFKQEFEKHSDSEFASDVEDVGELTKQQLEGVVESLQALEEKEDTYPAVRGSAASLRSAIEDVLDEWDIE